MHPTKEENTTRVLIVGVPQDPSEALALQTAFRRCDVRIAKDGSAAIETAVEFDPDLVLVDVARTELRGSDIARTLKSRGCRAHIIGVAETVQPNRNIATHPDCDVVLARPIFSAVIDALARELASKESSDLSP